jgi:hypothetical protein
VSERSIDPRLKTSIWIKIGVITLVLIAGMLIYQQITASRLAECKSKALLASSIIQVLDVRLSGLKCEFLTQHVVAGRAINTPDWQPEFIFDIYVDKK